jgi:hypothetical protein
MGIEQLSDEQLDAFESNYRKAKKTEEGKYSLSEILLRSCDGNRQCLVPAMSPQRSSNWRNNPRMDCAPMVKSGLSFDRTLRGKDTRRWQS